MIPTGFRIREGRKLVGISQADLAAAAGAGLAVIVRAEPAAPIPQLTRKDSTAIQGVLEAADVVFVRENGGIGGIGVRFREVEQQ